MNPRHLYVTMHITEGLNISGVSSAFAEPNLLLTLPDYLRQYANFKKLPVTSAESIT